MRIIKALFSRLTLMVIAALIEITVIVLSFIWFKEKIGWIEELLRVLSLVISLFIIKDSKHLSSDMLWIVLIIALPVAGTALYLLLGANMVTSNVFRDLVKSTEESSIY